MDSVFKKWVFLLVGFLLTTLFFNATAQARHRYHYHYVYTPTSYTLKGTSSLNSEINRIIQSSDPRATVGVIIKSMRHGDVVYQYNEEHLFVPASTMKLLTAEAALIYLGPQYKFPTRILTDATSVNNGVLNGNIYLVHSGDPSLTYNDLNELVSALKARQIERITGNVYIDTTAYDQENFGPGWAWTDTRYCYGAPISASIINRNCLSFRITPSKTSGALASVISDPFASNYIQNSVITRTGSSRSCTVRLETGRVLSVSGCLSKGHVLGGSTVVTNVIDFNKSLLSALFRRFGIYVNGKFASGEAPPNLTQVASHESKPLSALINDMLKMSDNVIAGSLFKKVGALYNKRQGSWENGSRAVSQILSQHANVNPSRINILDGSGLSPENLITPSQLLHVLDFAYHNDSTNSQLISALPIAGVDGTLKHRLQHLAWRVRAKTGTMAGVRSLAGYAINQDKEPFAFVIMVNGRNNAGYQYKELEDKIVTALARYSR